MAEKKATTKSRNGSRKPVGVVPPADDRYRILAEGSPDAILRSDADGFFVDVNSRAVEMTGYSAEELARLTIIDLIDPLDISRDPIAYPELRRGERVIKERVIRRKDGSTLHAEVHAQMLDDGSILATARDLSPVIESRAQARFHSSLLQRVQDAVVAVDAALRITLWNRRAEALYQFEESEVLGRSVVDLLVSPDRLADVQRQFARLATRGSWQGEFPAIRKDGTVVPVYLTVSALRGEDDTLQGFVGISRATDSEARTEAALAASEARLQSLIDRTSDAIYSIDLNQTVVTVNPAFETMTGWKPSEVIGRKFQDFLHPEDLVRGGKRFESVMTGGSTAPMEFRVRDARGGYVFIESTSTPLFEEGRVAGVFGIARNVTERRSIDAERAALMDRITLLLQSVHEGILAFDREGRCAFANPAAIRMFGVPLAVIEGKRLHDILHGGVAGSEVHPADECLFQMLLENPDAVQFEDTALRSDGGKFPLLISLSPLGDDRGARGFVVTLLDVTERNALQHEVAKRERLAGLGRVAASIAHEFNNLLMAIQPFAEMIGRASDSPPVTRAASQIERAVARGRAVTQEILRFTRPVDPVHKAIDPEEWLGTVDAQLRAVAGPNVSVDCVVERDTPVISGDREQLSQIVSNLVLNSAQAGATRITVSVRGSAEPLAGSPSESLGCALLTVRDNGPGIDPDVLAHIFEPFFSTRRGGTGLGLAIVHQLVQLHGGAIAIESEPGKGAQFDVRLPVYIARAQPPRRNVPAPEEVAVDINRVLLIEDDESVASGIAALLESEGIAVHIAPTGGEGIRAIEEKEFDAVVLDVGLPDMTGIEVFQQIRIARPNFPVVFSTGHGDESYARAVDRRAVEFLMKPYAIDTLLRALQSVVSRSLRRIRGG